MHPGFGNLSNTLLNGIIYNYNNNKRLPRAGIIHRLDKNTTGLLVISKKLLSYYYLVQSLKERKIKREYDVIVWGQIYKDGVIELPIKRDTYCRTKMMVGSGGKNAITYYKVIAIFRNHTHLRVKLETGRTHQIRVHFSYISHPILGDSLYFKRINKNIYSCAKNLNSLLSNCSRPLLHASKIFFFHFFKKIWLDIYIAPPLDMEKILHYLYSHNLG